MKNLITPAYTFTPGASGVGTVNLSGISGFNVKRLSAIINLTRGVVIYAGGLVDKRYTNLSGTTLTLFFDTSTHNAADVLQVIYDASESVDVNVAGVALDSSLQSILTELSGKVEPSDLAGLSTAALQTAGNSSLSSIDSKLPSLSGGRVPVDIGGGTVTLSGTVEVTNDVGNPLPVSGTVNTGLTQPLTDAQLRATAVPVSGPLTDTQLRASAVPVSGPLTDTQLRASAVAVTDSATSSINTKTPALVGGAVPSLMKARKDDGTEDFIQATENGALNIGNAYKKFRDGFADLAQNADPDTAIWDFSWTNQGTSTEGRAGDAQGSSYMKISMCPITAGSEFIMTTKRTFKYPMRFISMLSLSQRIIGQEFEISIVGTDTNGNIVNLSPITDLSISGTVTIASNVAIINFASAHNLKTGDRVILVNNTVRSLNVGPVLVTVVTATQITVPCTLSNGTYTAGGVVRWVDPLAYAKNGAGLLHENSTATNATFLTRRNGFNTRQLNSTIVTTANATAANYADPFNATSMNMFIANQEEFTVIPRAPDSINAPAAPLKWHQGLPDEELDYKIRIRAKNLDNMTRPVARITAIAKTGTTTATVTTDVPHGLATTDFVQIYGVRDITNFPNLVASTQVASVPTSTTFTIVIGAAVTASSAGGTVFINQGSVLAPGISAINVQSISRTNNIMTLVGNTTWTGYLPGETVHLYGCDATSMGLYDGAYKVLRINTTSLELESVGGNFTTINCGGAVMRRTDFRIHAISQIEHTRLIAELSNAQGSADASKSVPVSGTLGASQSGTWTVGISASQTLAAVTAITNALPVGANVIGQVGLQSAGSIADIASAALTTTTTTTAITPTFGTAYIVTIPVTAVSGTNPVLDISVEESTDNGTNWFKVYDFPRITATGFYNSPILRLRGTRVRYVQTVGGTTPSFTRSLNRSQISHAATQVVQLVDRTIVPNTLNSTTPALLVEGCQDFNILVRCTAQTTAATIALQFSHDGTNWHTTTNTLATAVGIAHAKVQNEQWKFARLLVSAAGTGITLAEAMIVGNGR